MHSEIDRRVLKERARRMTPLTEAKWGKMKASQMVAHLTNSMRMAPGDLPVQGHHLRQFGV